MRIWSLHPKHLDSKGLTAAWREALLARKVLEGKTKGYKNHPQLLRFKKHPEPLKAINYYLHEIYGEAKKRGFNFSKEKLEELEAVKKIKVTRGQLEHEYSHLLKKLENRGKRRYEELLKEKICHNPLFKAVKGKVENWEKS